MKKSRSPARMEPPSSGRRVPKNFQSRSEIGDLIADEITSTMVRVSTEPRRLTRLKPHPGDGVWKLFAGAATYLVAQEAVPEEERWLKVIGYSVTSAFAVSGLSNLLQVDENNKEA